MRLKETWGFKKNMKFKEYLNELSMKSKTQVNVKQGKNYLDANITTTDGEKFELTIDQGSWRYMGRNIQEWEIVFTDASGTIHTNKKTSKVAFELFAAIEKIVTDFIKKYKPEGIRFTGIGMSKTKLYDLLAKKIEKSEKYINIDPSNISAWVLVRVDILKSLGWKL